MALLALRVPRDPESAREGQPQAIDLMLGSNTPGSLFIKKKNVIHFKANPSENR